MKELGDLTKHSYHKWVLAKYVDMGGLNDDQAIWACECGEFKITLRKKARTP